MKYRGAIMYAGMIAAFVTDMLESEKKRVMFHTTDKGLVITFIDNSQASIYCNDDLVKIANNMLSMNVWMDPEVVINKLEPYLLPL